MVRPRRIFPAGLILLTFFWHGLPSTPLCGQEPEVVRLGSWNIQWLGRPDRRGGSAQDASDLAKYIQASKVDVLALSEVSCNSDDGPLPTNTTLTRAFAQIKESTGQEWKHLLFLKEDATDKDQLCGVAWNTAKVKMVGWPYQVPIRRWGPSAFVWTRHPHAVKFSAGEGKTDFVVIPVHMKSNRGGEEATSKQRAEEAKTLVRNLGGIQNHFKDDDLVILGDFNMLRCTEMGHARYTQNGFRDLNAADAWTWIKDAMYAAAPFDRIFVPDNQFEFDDCTFKVCKTHHLADEPTFRSRVSDHYLVLTEVRVHVDDD